ncbi:HIF1AN (predicted) [Pycnogonum litorale]
MEMDDVFHGYPFKTAQIPRVNFDDPQADELISHNRPVVIQGTNLVSSALKWDLPYLQQHLGSDEVPVFLSNTNKFKYFDDSKIRLAGKTFSPPCHRDKMTVSNFVAKLRNWKAGDKWLYLQYQLTDSVGQAIVDDFLTFNWPWVTAQQKKHQWGPLTSNLLLVGMPGSVTPVHYDEQQNFFGQLYGEKRCILFPPEQFECLYPHPVFHPHDRQSQVDFDNPDYKKYPKFKDIKNGVEAIVKPGDILFIPMYWWHHIESLVDHPYTVSINFWYKSGPAQKIEYPLNGQQKTAIMRNVEKMLLEALQSPEEVTDLLQALVLGRYT